jgi:hypothetical protein
MRIHLSLNGIFSSFSTRALTLEEIEDWENYPIVFITPDSVTWDLRKQEAIVSAVNS